MNDNKKDKEDKTIHTGSAQSRGKDSGNEMQEDSGRPDGSDHGDQGRASYVTGSTTQGGSNFGQGSASLGGESYKQGDTKNTGSDYGNEAGRFAETGTGADGEMRKDNTSTSPVNDPDQNLERNAGKEID